MKHIVSLFREKKLYPLGLMRNYIHKEFKLGSHSDCDL